MFEIGYESDRGLLRVRLTGFWSLETIAAFQAELAQFAQRFGTRPGPIDVIADARDFPVQSQEVSHALGDLSGLTGSRQGGRTAVLVSGVLNKLQARRMNGAAVRIFFDSDEAEAWLRSA